VATIVWIGSAIGFLAGMLHAAEVFRNRMTVRNTGVAGALYYAVWTLLLWIAFGTYVLVFWLLGAFGLVVSRLSVRGGDRSR